MPDEGIVVKLVVANLTNGGLSGGYAKYLGELLPRLAADGRVGRLDIFLPGEAAGVSMDLGRPGIVHAWPRRDPMRGYPWVRAAIRRLDPDVVFIPTGRWIDCGPVATAVMLRNMEPFEAVRGNPASEKLRNALRARTARAACLRATRTIGVSEYVSRFAVERLGVAPERVATICHGISPAQTATACPAALSRDAVGEFLFTAGSLRPARGLDDAIAALALVGRKGWRPRLVIAGSPTPGTAGYPKKMRRLASRLGVERQLAWLGHVKAEEMGWCFRHCKAFVMTSRAEACPNTVLESLQHGCLAVSTDQMPMPEFFADTAGYYSAGDPESLAGQLLLLREMDVKRKRHLRAAATARAAEFSWDRTARRTLDCLLDLAGAARCHRAA